MVSADRLRLLTLGRQFPRIRGRGPAAVLTLFDRLGPIQSQTPRSPFLTVASRLPGVRYATVNSLFAEHALLRATSIRGTVHTSRPATFRALEAVADRVLTARLGAMFALDAERQRRLADHIDDFCRDGWQRRDHIVDRIEAWLESELGQPPADLRTTLGSSLVWGRPSLVRRPPEGAWERRTDVHHRLADAVLPPDLARLDPGPAVATLARTHLAAFGPATRRDIAWWLGEQLTRVDAAIAALGDEVVRLTDGRDPLLDLAEPPTGGHADPGIRMLPEFDGLVLGHAPENRDRFLAREHLPLVFRKTNGQFSPTVLRDGRIVATWRTTKPQRRTDLEVTTLPGQPPLTESDLSDAVAATAQALALQIEAVRITRR